MNDDELASYLVRILLRYFRGGAHQQISAPQIHESDYDLLLFQWSISSKVHDLCLYVARNTHELRAALHAHIASSNSGIRGRIRAADSIVLQERTGDPSNFVYEEPFRSYDAGPNRLLGWVLTYATQLARRFRSLLPIEAAYYTIAVERLRVIEDARRVLPFAAMPLRMPTADDIRSARTSRIMLYRKAVAAFDYLNAIRRLDPQALEGLLRDSLIGPMERWRQFELALALAMAQAIAARTSFEISLRSIVPGTADSIIDVGPYAIRWQQPGPGFLPPMLEPWERRAREILQGYDAPLGYERPDVVVFDRRTDRVVAIGEAKYFDSDDWKDRLRDAVSQIIGYARGYEQQQDVNELLGRSVIALWRHGSALKPQSNSPCVVGFDGLRHGLEKWAEYAIA